MFDLKDMDNLYKEDVLLENEDFYNRAEIVCDKTGLNNKMSLMIDTVAHDSYTLSKYNALNFEEFKDYLIKNNLLSNVNEDIKIINTWLLNELSINFITIMNSLGYRNISFAMRIIRKSFSLIIKGIFLNLVDENGNYYVIDSFKDFCEQDVDCSAIDNFIDGPLEWLAPAAKALNEELHVFENIEGDALTIEMLARLLTLHDLKPSLINTKQYLHHSITELFSNSKNPTIEYYFLQDEDNFNYLGSLEKECMDNSVINEVLVFQALSCLVESSLEILDTFGLNQKDLNTFIHYLDLILSFDESDLDDSEEIDYEEDDENLYDEGFISSEELEYPFDIRYNDDFFYRVLNGKNTNSKDEINSYFCGYNNKYLVASDVLSKEDSAYKKATKLAYKYLNIFRSLLIGMRFDKTEFSPKKVLLKDSSFSEMIDENFGDKIIFDSTEFERLALDEDEIKSNILLITLIQNMINICNSIIAGDVSSCLVEVKSLYDMAIIKTYINVMGDDCLKAYLDECFLLSQKSIQETKIMEVVLEELEDEQPLSKKKEMKLIEAIDGYEEFAKYQYPSPFDFAPNNINTIADMTALLKDSYDFDFEVLDFSNIGLLYRTINNPFEEISTVFDSKLSLILLQCSQLIVSTLVVEPLYEQNKKMQDVISVCKSLIQFDLKGISKS